jgi:hypothetical protein
MFWVIAMRIASSLVSRVEVMASPLCSFVRSSTAKFASFMSRSFSRFVCFQMTFRHSANAMSTVQRVCPFCKRFVMVALACLELDSLRISFRSTLESRIIFVVLCPP